MAVSSYKELSEMQLDVLREIGNIGSGNAATALSNMLNRPINIGVPIVKILDYNEVTGMLGGPEKMLIGIMLTFTGDVEGMILFLLEREFAHETINTLLGMTLNDFNELDDMGISTMQEVGNIMAASYINAISQLTNLSIGISPPALTIDMVGSILSVPAIHFANISDRVIFIDGAFELGVSNQHNNILLIPEIASLEKIMNSLGIDI